MNPVGKILAVCVSERKGTVKHSIPRAELREDHGIVGDAHSGPGHRQVSLLDAANVQTMKNLGLDLKPGAFGENLIVEGLPFADLGIGTRLKAGSAILELTQIGKVCHTRCAIYFESGDCIMPRAGLFARVVSGGEIESGMEMEAIQVVQRSVFQAAVLTVSDRCAAGEAKDTAGPAAAKLLETELPARLAWTGIVPDEQDQITTALRDLAERSLNIVVTVGGTGCAPRDVTPEATRALIQKEVPGLAEAMRRESSRITPNAMTQRGVSGIYLSTLIVNLPGSEKAAVENLGVILTALRHGLRHLRGEKLH
jgi:molybdenum cofactor synthesis domain-containing protein